MQYVEDFPGIHKRVSRLVQGTVMINSHQIDQSFHLLDTVFEQGCTTFDTAHGYGNGDCERTVGRWVRERGLRDQVVIIGKGAHHSQDRRRVTPFDISADLHDSLARFQFDYIDLYLLHRDDPYVPVGPIVEVLNEHLQAGRVNAFGGSNWTHERIQEANDYAETHGLVPMVASSPNYSLAVQVEEPWENCISISGRAGKEARDWYRRTQMPLFAWSSLAGGFFSGRFGRDNLDTFDEYLDIICVNAYCYETNFRRLDRVKQLADEKGVTVPQLALAYVMSQPMNTYALVGCQSGVEFEDNIVAIEMRLTAAELEWLDLRDDNKGVVK